MYCWLEQRLKSILSNNIEIVPYDTENYEDTSYDIWVAADQAEKIAADSGIRISSNKDLTLIAIDNNGDVLGAVWSDIRLDDDHEEEDIYIYDFDIAVDRTHRAQGLASPKIGIKLIDAALEDFRWHRTEREEMYVRVWVVNPGLARYLEKRYGFTVEAEHSNNSVHMVYHD